MTDDDDNDHDETGATDGQDDGDDDDGDNHHDDGRLDSSESDAAAPVYDWSAFLDDEGRTYYYNSVTGESSWDAPDHYNPPPPEEDAGGDDTADGSLQYGRAERNDDDNTDGRPDGVLDDGDKDGDAVPMEESEAVLDDDAGGRDKTAQADEEDEEQDGGGGDIADAQDYGDDDEQPPVMAGDWVEYKDDEGRVYYFNTVTEETTWDRPAEFDDETENQGPGSPSGDVDDDMSPSRPQSPIGMEEYSPNSPDMAGGTGEESETDDGQDKMVDEPKEEPIDPAAKRLAEAKAALAQPDSILESGIMTHLTEVVTSDKGNPANAIQAMSESTRGQTAVCGLLSRWLADLKTGKRPITVAADVPDESKRFQKATDYIREMTQDVVNSIATERFTNKGGDSILNLSRSEAAFLEDMMDSNRWRKLLIDLSAANKDSALLMYCLQAISKRGHHREIARRIKQSDHFAVFNAMLASELSVIGKIAVSACHDHDTSISLNELTGDLQRICTSTAYTYMYSYEVLSFLVKKAKKDSSSMAEAERLLYARVIRKWERLLEVLQSTMIDPSDSAASSPLFRKRRLDVACTMSELHQRQRRRILPSTIEEGNGEIVSMDDRRSEIESALLSFLRNYCLGTQLDDPVLDKMLPNALGGDPTNFIGNLLIQYPISVEALLGYIFKPGNQRARSGATRNKCARLIAKAVMAAEEKALVEARKVNQKVRPSDFDEVNLESMLCEGSKLCEQLENMVSFIATAEAPKRKGALSPGEQLCRLAVTCAPVSQGVAMWAREITKGGEFVASASYPTISPNIMSLVRIIYLQHPFTRDDTCAVAFEFLRHANSEIAYQTMNHIKEQSLRLLLFLCVRGEAPTVLDRVVKLIKDPTGSVLDASLIRYFVSGLLEVAQPPFSIPFIRSFSNLLKSRACVEAIKTSYFDEDSKRRLDATLKYLKTRATGKLDSRALSKEDVGLMQSLLSIYSI